jgi:hypothetical protein
MTHPNIDKTIALSRDFYKNFGFFIKKDQFPGNFLEKHPDGNPIDHEQKFHFPTDVGKESPAKSARTDCDNPGPGHVQPVIHEGEPAKEFHPQPKDLGKHKVAGLVACQGRRGKTDTQGEHPERHVFQGWFRKVHREVGEQAKNHQGKGKNPRLLKDTDRTAPKKHGGSESHKTAQGVQDSIHYSPSPAKWRM